MDLNHIQLNTKDVKAAAEFYGRYFGFTTQKADGEAMFIWNKHGFMMAVNPLAENPVFPDWFHIGFRLETPEEIKSLYHRLVEEKIPIKAALNNDDAFLFFRCIDPSGYVVEVFWAPVSED